MKLYKSINNYFELNSKVIDREKNIKYMLSYSFENYYDFGEMFINDNFVSTIKKRRFINIFVVEHLLDEFIYVFFKSRIVLTEKNNKKIKFLEKSFWNDVYFYKTPNSKIKYYIFQNVPSNFVKMNDIEKEIIIPFI